ncbi:MAG: hypothetical protein ABW165_09440, partial [Candidatus Thiodiazotropha sp.]
RETIDFNGHDSSSVTLFTYYRISTSGTVTLGPVNTNPIGPVVPEIAPIKAHPKGTSFGAQPVGLGLFFRPAALSFAHVA